jgi:TetR/AcrR family transcriptional regulator, transcriptional repressor of aconitase
MPKVSQEHMERRRQQILDAARECFTRDGFHNTSMQDIFRASGLSAGAVYRYFPSKHLLIKALAEQTLTSAMAVIDLGDANPRDAGEILEVMIGELSGGGWLARTGAIAVQVWAEAFRDPEMAVIARELLELLLARVESWLPEGSPPETARLVLATLQGFVIQAGVFGDLSPELVATGVRGLTLRAPTGIE